jgi:hypothetical protein
MYFETVDRATVKPSFSSSPWMRGAPQSRFSSHMRRMRSRSSRSTLGRPPELRDFQRHQARKPESPRDATQSQSRGAQSRRHLQSSGKADTARQTKPGRYRTIAPASELSVAGYSVGGEGRRSQPSDARAIGSNSGYIPTEDLRAPPSTPAMVRFCFSLRSSADKVFGRDNHPTFASSSSRRRSPRLSSLSSCCRRSRSRCR